MQAPKWAGWGWKPSSTALKLCDFGQISQPFWTLVFSSIKEQYLLHRKITYARHKA